MARTRRQLIAGASGGVAWARRHRKESGQPRGMYLLEQLGKALIERLHRFVQGVWWIMPRKSPQKREKKKPKSDLKKEKKKHEREIKERLKIT